MNRHLRRALGWATLSVMVAAPALAQQSPEAVQRVAEAFLRDQIQGVPGASAVSVGTIDRANRLAPCQALQAFLPAGARPWGRTTIGVRCLSDARWSVFVPAHVKVTGAYVVTARPLRVGQIIEEADLASQQGDLSALPAGVALDSGQVVGRSASSSLAAGQPVRADLLRQPLVIQQGQSVRVVSRGPGFQVATEGRALNNAANGQVAQVRAANGQTLSGIARSKGVVEIAF